MRTSGELRIDSGALENAAGPELEVVVLYTVPDVTRAVLGRAASLTGGWNARVALVAVHTVPYPTTFGCPSSTHAFLVEQLLALSASCPFPVHPRVVLARSREEGFRHALPPGSTVLLGGRRRFWRTAEERLARALVRSGHRVALVYVE